MRRLAWCPVWRLRKVDLENDHLIPVLCESLTDASFALSEGDLPVP